MEAVSSSKTSVNIYQSTRYHIPDDNTLLRVMKAKYKNLFFVFLYPEDVGNKFLRNVDKLLPEYTVSHPRR
jgi:hypothetical protein